MKLTALMAGVAALSLVASGASAQTLTQTVVTGPTSTGGAAATPASATFNLKAVVAKDCSFYNNGSDVDIDFGTVGIYNNDSATVAQAFTMTGGLETQVNTSLAGCNFNNTMRIEKDKGALTNETPGNYDATQFQATIPYRVVLNFSAPEAGSNITNPVNRLRTNTDEGFKQRSFAAWKSPMRIDFIVPAAALALVAGTYTDSVDVTITAL